MTSKDSQASMAEENQGKLVCSGTSSRGAMLAMA